MEFSNVSVSAKANVYFEGRVVSHTVLFPTGERKTVGVILPGSYHFGTKQAERMELVQGGAEVLLDGKDQSTRHVAEQATACFDVPANSGFTITVKDEPCHYICSFLGE